MTGGAKKVPKNLSPVDEKTLSWDDLPGEVRSGVLALKDKKIEDVRVYDLREFTPFCDFVIIGTAQASVQAKVAKEELTKIMRDKGFRVYGIEGEEDSGWLLIDFWDVVVHLFKPETRDYYNLEALWADFPWWPGEITV